jgi:large subunit ribosomal protein L28
LRTHRDRSDGRPQCEPLEHQDQAPLPAGPVARHLQSDSLGQTFKLRISNAALRTLDFRGGLDVFLLGAKDEQLSPRALKIKTQVKAKAKAAAVAA